MNEVVDLCKYADVFYGNGLVDHFPEDGLSSKWFYIKALCGNTTPHAVLPFGRMSVGAYSGGYPTGYGTHYPNSCGGFPKLGDTMKIRGFSHLHQSGTGAIKFYYNYAVTTPFYGALEHIMEYLEPETEEAKPGWYKTKLRDIQCELTVNKDTAIHRYCFPKAGGRVAIDFANDGLWKAFGPKFSDCVTDGELILVADNEILFSGVMQGIRLYFCACAEVGQGESRQEGAVGIAVKTSLFENSREIPDTIRKTEDAATNYGAVFEVEGCELLLKLSYSTIGYQQAREQVYRTASFEETAKAAYDIWNKHLSVVQIETDREDLKEKFYSNLYHSLIKPCDMTGEQMLGIKGDLVLDFATLWDQYKTACPLIYLLYPDMSEKMVKGILNVSRTLGKIPCGLGLTEKFPSEGQAKMLGIMTLCDAYYSGVKGVNPEVIAECVKRELAREDFASFVQEGFLEKTTHILDAADGCLAAERIVEDEELKAYLRELGSNWRNAYGEDGLLSEKAEYYEGTKYTYSFRLQQNMEERIAYAGGTERFVQLLDEFFGFYGESIRQITTEEEIPLIEEINQRLHRFQGFNNEGDMEAPYAYIYAGRQDKTCEITHEALEKTFGLGKGGLPGNNDSGALSSCFVWNTLGMFPASGRGEILLVAPHVDKVVLSLSNGNTLEIIAENLSSEKYHVEKVTFNGEEIADFRIPTQKLMQGGKLVYLMK